MRSILLLSTCAALAGCAGHYRPPGERAETEAEPEEDDERRAARDEDDEEEDDEDDDDGPSGSATIDAALTGVRPLSLGDATTVPGTGVTLRPPAGSDPIPFGGGFVSRRSRVQLSVVVAQGGEDLLEAMRTGGAGDAPEPEDEEDVTIGGVDGQIGRDRARTQAGVLERMWLMAHDGNRALGVIAMYEADRASAYRSGIRESLQSVEWDREFAIDAAAALGIALGPIEGLEMSRRSTANVVYLQPSASFPPEPGEPVLTVSPLPMAVPPDQVARACPQIAARLVPAPSADVPLEGTIEGPLPGCERLAMMDTEEGGRVATYAGLIFHEGAPLLVTASVDADDIDTWRPRFASAARSVRIREAE